MLQQVAASSFRCFCEFLIWLSINGKNHPIPYFPGGEVGHYMNHLGRLIADFCGFLPVATDDCCLQQVVCPSSASSLQLLHEFYALLLHLWGPNQFHSFRVSATLFVAELLEDDDPVHHLLVYCYDVYDNTYQVRIGTASDIPQGAWHRAKSPVTVKNHWFSLEVWRVKQACRC